jgi:uncharacterized protein (TIGR02118 family)
MMLRVIGFYRWSKDASFDHAYYNAKHMHLTRELLTPHGLIRLESDRYLLSAPPVEGQIIAASNAYFSSVSAAQAALSAVGHLLLEDVKNYTTLKPELHFVEVVSHK